MPNLPAAAEGANLLVASLILAAATWRVSSLFTYERGPFAVFVWIRSLAGIRHNEFGHPNVIPDGFWPELLTCVWCCSTWVGLGFAVLYAVWPAAGVLCGLPFALSAGAILLSKHIK